MSKIEKQIIAQMHDVGQMSEKELDFSIFYIKNKIFEEKLEKFRREMLYEMSDECDYDIESEVEKERQLLELEWRKEE